MAGQDQHKLLQRSLTVGEPSSPKEAVPLSGRVAKLALTELAARDRWWPCWLLHKGGVSWDCCAEPEGAAPLFLANVHTHSRWSCIGLHGVCTGWT